jgi:adenosylmethionine-8-amino-7-oxononanoate aminotransferase
MTNLLLHFAKSEIDDLLVLERGEGPYVFDTDGRRYIDALSSLFCAQIGYSHGEEMAAAARRQLTTLAFNTNWGTAHPTAARARRAPRRGGAADLDRVFFTSGGSESVEAAWKLCRDSRSAPRRSRATWRTTR